MLKKNLIAFVIKYDCVYKLFSTILEARHHKLLHTIRKRKLNGI